MNDKNLPIIAFVFIGSIIVFFVLMTNARDARQELLEERLYNADQDRIVECAITHGPEYCHLLINGNCDENI